MASNGGLLSFTYLLLFVTVAALLQYSHPVHAETRHYNFHIRLKKVSRLCHSKYIVTANGKFPGPTIYAREGDTVLVNVTNYVKYNVTIHWHGVRQLRTGWFDGPAYITQCPIPNGHSFLYNFTITGQRGTLFWHAHILWLRATLHGPIVILPPKGTPYPFPKPDKEVILVLGQWWNSDTEAVINEAMAAGRAPNVSDAHTINGKPGPLFNYSCATKDTFALNVESNKTYMLRIINAGLNEDVFFEVAGHLLRVVEVDATYVKPFDTRSLFVAPGQTSNVLLKTGRLSTPTRYFMSIRTFMDAPIAVDNKTTTAILQYADHLYNESPNADSKIVLPVIPAINDSAFVANFSSSLRSLNSAEYPARVPHSLDKKLFFTVGLALDTCPTCLNGTRAVAAINNISFVMPNVSLLQAHYFNISGVFTADFPDNPPKAFNYTGKPPKNLMASKGTRVTRLPFNSSVELVLQDTSLLAPDSHPIHLHGFNFFVVGRGVGNYDAKRDPLKFNLVDPPERNTVTVPTGGWTAIRWRADNPGVWFMHCHFEVHTTWGLKMAFLVDNGPSPHQSILSPPHDLPKC